MSFVFAIETAAEGRKNQDRAAVWGRGGGLVVVLADGAGGTGNGDVAAQAVVDAAARSTADAGTILDEVDSDPRGLRGGLTTAVILRIDARGVFGASVGDSAAWLVSDEVVDLTAAQRRKPLVGDGCLPVAFSAGPLGRRTLVVGSDGLFAVARRDDIRRIAVAPDLGAAARALVELVRLPTGGLQDDVTVVLCRALA